MFALKPRIETTVRVLLTALMLFNAVIPTASVVHARQEDPKPVESISQSSPPATTTDRQFPIFGRPSARLGTEPQKEDGEPSLANEVSEGLKTSTVFIENVGQFDSRARFQTQSGNVTGYFSNQAIWLTIFEKTQNEPELTEDKYHQQAPRSQAQVKAPKGVNIKMDIVGANAHPVIQGLDELKTNYSYFIGQTDQNWQVDVPAWQSILYKNIFPGLDLKITGDGEKFEWEFIIRDPDLLRSKNNQVLQNGIRVQIHGHKKLGLLDKNAEIETEVGNILLPEFAVNGKSVVPELQNDAIIVPLTKHTSALDYSKTVAYSQNSKSNTSTPSGSDSIQSQASQNIPPLSPSETLLYSTYLGGAIPRYSQVYENPYANEKGAEIAVAGDYIYIAGFSQSADFPNSAGTFTVKFGETSFAQAYSPYRPFVAKLNIATNQLVYVDYFNLGAHCNNPITGGTDFKTGVFHALSADSAGNVYVGGTTVNFEFPLTANARDTTINEQCLFAANGSFLTLEGFVAKLDPTGTQLLYASYFGGSNQDTVTNLENDNNGNVYIVGNSYSSNLPSGGTILDPSYNGGLDTFVTKINTVSGQQSYFSYIGGNTTDDPLGTALGSDGSLYLTGRTWSTNFTGTTPGSSSTCSTCPADGFALRLAPAGTLGYSRYLGGTGGDLTASVALDSSNNAFVAGYTSSTNFPVSTTKTDTDVYISKLGTDGSILYATRFGGSAEEGYNYFGYDLGGAIGLDNEGKVYVVGTTLSTDFPITQTAYDKEQDQTATNQDLFLTKIDPDRNQIMYSTYFGGSLHEITTTEITVDAQRNVYLMIPMINSADLPLRNAYSSYKGDWDMAIAKLSTNVPVIPLDITLSLCPADCAISSVNSDSNGSFGGPINTRTGAYDYTTTDLSIPTLAGTLSFERIYSSFTTSMYAEFGPGWTHNHDVRLIFPSDPLGVEGQILFKAHSSNVYNFFDMGDGTYKPYPGIKASLTLVSSSPVRYEVRDSTQAVYTLDATGKLLTYTDAKDHVWTYSYYANGQLDRINADGGVHYLDLDYDLQGRVQSVRDHTGRDVSYHYNPAGDLDSFQDVLSQTWAYTYHPTLSHVMTHVMAPGNVTVERTEYYPDGRAWKQFDGEGNLIVELIYNSDGTTTIRDALNHSTTHTYDARGTLISEENGEGAEQIKDYDFGFRPGVVIDPLSNKTTLDWSDNGSTLEHIKDALGGETFITYGDYNNPTSVLDPMLYETRYYYEDINYPSLPTRVEYPLSFDGGVTYVNTDYEYYAPTTGYLAGKVKLVTDDQGNQTYYTYEPTGQIAAVTTDYGTPEALTTSYSYSNLGQLTDITNPQQVVTHNEYDDAGRLLKSIHNYVVSRPQNDENRYNLTTEYRYDERGNLIAVIDTTGMITRTYYDLANRPVTTVENLVVSGTPDDVNTPISSIPPYDPDFPDQNIRNDTEYDDAGNVIVTRDPSGIITRTYYDEANRPILEIVNWAGTDLYGDVSAAPAYDPAYPDTNIRTESFYDMAGNLIATRNTLGVITRTYYDELNQPVSVIQNLYVSGTLADINLAVSSVPAYNSSYPDRNLRTDTIYDINGNVIATRDPRGVVTRRYYDSLNRPVTVIQNLSNWAIDNPIPPDAGASDTNIRTDTYYDPAGNIIATVDPRGSVTRTYYDASNRPIAMVENWIGTDIYDPTIPARDSGAPDENIRTDIVYDAYSRKDAIIDPLGRVTKYQYDVIDQVISTTANYVNGGYPQNDGNQRNIVTTYEYDSLGRLVKYIDTLSRTTLNTYDDLGRLVTTTQNYLQGQPQNYKDSSGDQYNIRTHFSYDVRSNQIAITDTKGMVTRTFYDAVSRPVSVVRNFTGVITDPTPPERGNPPSSTANLRSDIVYLGSGNVDFTLDELGKKTDYELDALGRMIVALDPLLNATTYAYDANGNRTLMMDAENVSTRLEYDNLNRLKAVVENHVPLAVADVETKVRTEYEYDAGGNRLNIRDGNSLLEGTDYRTYFTYDGVGRLKTEKDPLDHMTVYEYDKLGNRVSLLDPNGKTTIFGYDELNRLNAIDYPEPDADVMFAYDALGRRTSMTDGIGTTTWSYTNIDLPGQITDPFNTAIAYDYDSLGNRTELSYGANTYSYEYNALSQLSMVSGNGLPEDVQYGYDAVGRLKTIARPNGVNTSYNYFDNGWLQDITHTLGTTTTASYEYQYYKNGNRRQAVEQVLPPAFTSTATFTPTVTSTSTGTSTSTPSPTVTWTATATGPVGPTATYTSTKTPSATATRTATATFTPTFTSTASQSPTATPSHTPTPKSGSTSTFTQTMTSTATGTSTPTATSSQTLTPTATYTGTSDPVGNTVILQPDASMGLDTYISSSNKTTNYGTNTLMGVGEDNSSNQITRSLIRFDLSSIPANATITSAVLSLWTSVDLSDNTRTLRVYRLTRAFNEGQATWNIAASGVNWQSPGASGSTDREAADIGSVQILSNEGLNAEKKISLAVDKIQEITGGSFLNNGFILVVDTENNDRFNFKTSDNGTSTQRPKLTIRYVVPPTLTPTNTPTVTSTPIPVTITNTPKPSTATATSAGSGLTYNVSKTSDTNDGSCNSDCSLREAIIAANGHPGQDTISLGQGTYTLSIFGMDDNASAGDLDITDPVVIEGSGGLLTSINANGVDRVFDLPGLSAISITIRDLRITNGSATDNGGGIRSETADIALTRVLISGNRASNDGAGIYMAGGSLMMLESAVTQNTSDRHGGGVAFMSGSASFNNVTIGGNIAGVEGGGIYAQGGTMNLLNVTITDNRGGCGILCRGDYISSLSSASIGTPTPYLEGAHGGGIRIILAAVSIKNSVIAQNIDVSDIGPIAPDCFGSLTSQGHNLIGNNTFCNFTSQVGDQVGSGLEPLGAELGLLANNGGNTLTYALLGTSPAINAGDNTGCPAIDQRGYYRNGQCDIGAYEFGGTVSIDSAVVANHPENAEAAPRPKDYSRMVSYQRTGTTASDSQQSAPFSIQGARPPTSTPTATHTATATATASKTPTPTSTWDPSIRETGYRYPTSYTGTGFEENPSYALLDDGLFAVDHNPGNATTDCAIGASSDIQDFKTFDMQVPAGVELTELEVRLDAKVNDASGSPKICIYPKIFTGPTNYWYWQPDSLYLTTSENTYYDNWYIDDLGLVSDTIGSRLHIIVFTLSSTAKDFSLDSITANVHWVYPPTSTASVSTATFTPTVTVTASPTLTPTTTEVSVTPTASATTVATFTPSPPPTSLPEEPVTIDYVYDPLNRLTNVNYSNGNSYNYTYDAVGNRKTQSSQIGGLSSSNTYLYDHANQLINADGVTYEWDNNGNLLNDGLKTYTYDSANRLKTLIDGTNTYTFGYSGLGDRLLQSGVAYTLDLNAGLTQVLADGTNTYIYGMGRIAEQQGSSNEYYLDDALGSVRQIVDNAGSITQTKSYDPFGENTSAIGSAQTNFGFTGELTDPSGLLYLRARYYNSSNGRFLTRDPSKAESNLYRYAMANPVNYVDPTGLYTQKQIKQLFHESKYLEAINIFDDHIYLAGRWGFLEVLHRADNWDQVEFYKFALNGSCEVRTYDPTPELVIGLPSLAIGNVLHAVSTIVKGELYRAGDFLWLMNDAGQSTPIWRHVWESDYVILKNERGEKKFETFMKSYYAKYRLVWDEIDWPLFWRSAAEITGAVLLTLGVLLTSEVLFVIGLTVGAILTLIEVVEVLIKLIPLAQQIMAGQEPTEDKMQSLVDGMQFVYEDTIENTLDSLIEAQTQRQFAIPVFDIRDMILNVKDAIRYTP